MVFGFCVGLVAVMADVPSGSTWQYARGRLHEKPSGGGRAACHSHTADNNVGFVGMYQVTKHNDRTAILILV